MPINHFQLFQDHIEKAGAQYMIELENNCMESAMKKLHDVYFQHSIPSDSMNKGKGGPAAYTGRDHVPPEDSKVDQEPESEPKKQGASNLEK